MPHNQVNQGVDTGPQSRPSHGLPSLGPKDHWKPLEFDQKDNERLQTVKQN